MIPSAQVQYNCSWNTLKMKKKKSQHCGYGTISVTLLTVTITTHWGSGKNHIQTDSL